MESALPSIVLSNPFPLYVGEFGYCGNQLIFVEKIYVPSHIANKAVSYQTIFSKKMMVWPQGWSLQNILITQTCGATLMEHPLVMVDYVVVVLFCNFLLPIPLKLRWAWVRTPKIE